MDDKTKQILIKYCDIQIAREKRAEIRNLIIGYFLCGIGLYYCYNLNSLYYIQHPEIEQKMSMVALNIDSAAAETFSPPTIACIVGISILFALTALSYLSYVKKRKSKGPE